MEYNVSLQTQRTVARNKFLSRVYGWMVAALAISGISAFFAANSPTIISWLYRSHGYLILALIDLALVFFISAAIRKISASTATLAFIAYSVINGITLSSILLVYAKTTVIQVFFISSALFAVMAVYGMRTKSDIRSAGRYLYMAIWGVIIASLINFLMRSSALDYFISLATVVIFSGLTAHDANQMAQVAEHAGEGEVFEKAAVIGALSLYINFINIFLSLLRLLGRNRD